MSISDIHLSGKHKSELGHFANIVQIAKQDNLITEGEQKLLDRLASKLNVNELEYQKLLKEPEKYPLNPPVSYNERIERLYDLTKMIFADGNVSLEEVKLMQKIAIGLSFPIKNTEKICDEAVHLIMNNNNFDDFKKAIKKVNKI